jgi:hypothetical protein
MQYGHHTKLGRMTGKLPKLESKWGFVNRKVDMLSNNSSTIDQFCLLSQKLFKNSNIILAKWKGLD